MPKRDYHPQPFRTLVVLGESTVRGGPWLTGQERRWPDVLADLINLCQEQPVAYHNEGISASVISPRSPGYEASAKPSAMERYRERVIAASPDLFVMAYGLNDMRAGMDVQEFAEDMEAIVRDVKSACDPMIVLTTVYHITAFDRYPPFDKGSREAVIAYNAAIAGIAAENSCLPADVWSAQGEADWLVHQDGVHANAVGNLVIAHRVFEVIASNCSGLSEKTRRLHEGSAWTKTAARLAKSGIEPVERAE